MSCFGRPSDLYRTAVIKPRLSSSFGRSLRIFASGEGNRPRPTMIGGGGGGGGYRQLNDESDFEALLSPDGSLSVCGFGSLLSERSARSTFSELKNFRVTTLRGFRRVFCHAAPIFFERGIANEESRVVPESLDGTPFTTEAVLCARYSDEEYFQVRCKGSKEIHYQRYGNIHKIWRDDILPCRVYLRHCVLAAKSLGQAAYDNFFDHAFISDRKTTIREYLATTGSGIMEEEPPEHLRSRYGGDSSMIA
ncbi:hypothetical protein QJS10_CPB17g01207 [Acorus calamus]|uniref:Uncharacterized protein n=1 Tax=Acorus calamus TaxID=4465 RepID=A0AAV9CUI3_ACOCL|nr:hypothetical protein QJS10_CPB17g01207 [Acorus calamus]